MITKIPIALISFYQILLSPLLRIVLGTPKFCRFEETCSEFTKRSIAEKGILKGSFLGLARLLKCQPFYNGNLNKEVTV